MVCNIQSTQSAVIQVHPQVVLMVKCILLEVADGETEEQWRCVTTRHGEWCLD